MDRVTEEEEEEEESFVVACSGGQRFKPGPPPLSFLSRLFLHRLDELREAIDSNLSPSYFIDGYEPLCRMNVP